MFRIERWGHVFSFNVYYNIEIIFLTTNATADGYWARNIILWNPVTPKLAQLLVQLQSWTFRWRHENTSNERFFLSEVSTYLLTIGHFHIVSITFVVRIILAHYFTGELASDKKQDVWHTERQDIKCIPYFLKFFISNTM